MHLVAVAKCGHISGIEYFYKALHFEEHLGKKKKTSLVFTLPGHTCLEVVKHLHCSVTKPHKFGRTRLANPYHSTQLTSYQFSEELSQADLHSVGLFFSFSSHDSLGSVFLLPVLDTSGHV